MRRAVREWIQALAATRGIGLYRLGSAWRLIEPEQLTRFLSNFKIDCVFDVGANEGQYAGALRNLGYDGWIFSFEPHPEVAETLRQAAAADERWQVFETALDSASRPFEFNIMASSQFSSLREPDHSATGAFVDLNRVARKVSLTTRTLDQLYPELQRRFGFRRPFLKMDTQGHDLEVVRGAADVLACFLGLQSELALTILYDGAPDFAQSLAYYRSRGFRLSALVPNNQGHFPDLNEVDCIMYNPDWTSAVPPVPAADPGDGTRA